MRRPVGCGRLACLIVLGLYPIFGCWLHVLAALELYISWFGSNRVSRLRTPFSSSRPFFSHEHEPGESHQSGK